MPALTMGVLCLTLKEFVQPAAERVLLFLGLGDSLGLTCPEVIHWLGFFDVSASDLRYMMFPQFTPALSAR